MNIFNDSNYASQSSLPSTAIFTSITSNDYIIPASQEGDILYTNANHEINGLLIGPQNYLLQSSGSVPQWSNTLNINTVQTTSLKIPGTTHGDLFTVDNNNTFERVAIGPANSILSSNGTEFSWYLMNVSGPVFIKNNTLLSETIQIFEYGVSNLNLSIALPPAMATMVTHNFTTIVDRRYKLTINGYQFSTDLVAYEILLGPSIVLTQLINLNGCLSRTYIFTATNTTSTITLKGAYVNDVNSTLNQFYLILEPFN